MYIECAIDEKDIWPIALIVIDIVCKKNSNSIHTSRALTRRRAKVFTLYILNMYFR